MNVILSKLQYLIIANINVCDIGVFQVSTINIFRITTKQKKSFEWKSLKIMIVLYLL